jgi:uncharacterized membrane protein
MPKKREREKILILCVDRDNDIGVKGQVKTPIIGRKKNVEAASKLALKDPEEADANAIFDAVRTYDSLSRETGETDYEVATIAGSELLGVKADKNIVSQLEKVLKNFQAKNIVLVTDGFADEEVIPVIQSYVPIMSIRRVVVRHSEAIEESWALFSRYLRKLIDDPYYSRIALGVPGILLITLALLWIYNLLTYAGYAFLLIIGSVLFIKGFGIDKRVSSITFPSTLELVRYFTFITALIVLGIDAYQTYTAILPHYPDLQLWWSNLPSIAGLVIANATDLAVVAVCIIFVGRGIFYYFSRDDRIWRNGVGIVVAVWVREIAIRASTVLLAPVPPASISDKLIVDLLLAAGLGIAGTLIAVLVTISLRRRYRHYFSRRMGAKDE